MLEDILRFFREEADSQFELLEELAGNEHHGIPTLLVLPVYESGEVRPVRTHRRLGYRTENPVLYFCQNDSLTSISGRPLKETKRILREHGILIKEGHQLSTPDGNRGRYCVLQFPESKAGESAEGQEKAFSEDTVPPAEVEDEISRDFSI